MKRKLTLLFLVTLLAGLNAQAAFNLPKDDEGYYLISTPEDLVAFSDYVNNTVNANSSWGRLTADIDMSSVASFWPIGMYADTGGTKVQFLGRFDGAGHVIKNLTVAREDNYEVGLFSRTSGALIENLGIVNAKMSTTSEMDRNGVIGVRTGVIVGELNSSSILRNCWTAGEIELSTLHPQKGYLCGEASNNSQIVNCFSTGDVLMGGGSYILTNSYAGDEVTELAPTGELCFLLNGDQSKITWYQTLGEDELPCQDPTHKQVYGNGALNCDGSPAGALTYSNTSDGSTVPPHEFDDEGYCINCGFEGFAVVPTSDGWYEVTSPEELRWVSRYVNTGQNTIKVRLMNDLDMSSILRFPPMGKHRDNAFGGDDVNFRGTFDGQYHVIKNLFVEADDNYEAGFFGRTYQATVKNVGFVDATVINNSPGPVRAGVVGGELHQSTFTNVWTAGNLSVTTEHAQCAGFGGEAASSTLNNCWSTYEGLFVGENSTTLNNCYYFAKNEDIVAYAESGALCWVLNGKSFDPDVITYYQTLGDDSYPTWDKTHGLVYATSEEDYACAVDEQDFKQLVGTLILAEHATYEDIVAPASLIDTYLDRIDALESKSFPDFLAAYKGLQGLRDAIVNAQTSYTKYQDALKEVQAYVDENGGFFDGEERDLLINYLTKEVEPGDTYPNGSSLYILKNCNLNSNYVNSEIGYVQQLLNNAIQHGYAPGADITNMLVNPDFANAQDGWTTKGSFSSWSVTAPKTKYLMCGNNEFEISQTVTDMKNGLYEFRLGGYAEVSNGLLSGKYNYRSLIFANENANYQKPLFSDMLTAEEVAGYGGFEEKFDDLGESLGWKPNHVNGVATGVDLGHWNNRVIVEVTDGTLTVGLKGGKPYGLSNGDFFTNARLRYLGEMESEQATEAMTSLLEDIKQIATHMTDDYEPDLWDYKEAPNYYVGLQNELRAFVADIDKASTNAEKYALLSKVRDLFERINESKLIYSELRDMADELLDVYGINAPEQLNELDEKVINPILDMYESGEGSNEDALAFIDRMRNDDIYKVIRGHEPEQVDGVYQLKDAYNMIWFSNQSNNGNTALNAVLANDIDMSEIANFIPIARHRDDIDWDGDGTDDGVGIGTTYGGTFDGQGHVIRNLTVIVDDGCEAGLFSRASGATLKNIGFENATIKNTRLYNNDTQGVRAGVLAGEAYKCNVLNCYSVGNLVVETIHDQCNGLCGEAASSSVLNCYTTFNGNAVSSGSQVNVFNGPEVAEIQKTGELAYRLNGDQSEIAFYQTLGEDDYPILDSTHKQVYGHGTIACDGGVTDNTSFDNVADGEAIRLDHAFVDGVCENCGFDSGVITEIENGYYLISNPYNLRWFSKFVNSGNGSANARLTVDIDMKDIKDFAPIARYSDDGTNPVTGQGNVTYSGTFDGDFHVIRNLNMEFNERIEGGLFGRMVAGGVIKNLGMENVHIANLHSNGCRVGCVVGENNGGTVQNVYTIGDIELTTFHAQKCGIAGEAAEGSQVNCYTTWNVLQNRGSESNCYAGEDVAAMGPTGELCYKLNNGVVNDPTWRQTLGTDNYPIFRKESKVVYPLGDGFTNEIPALAAVEGTEEDPFVIKTAQDLLEVRKYMNQSKMNYIVLEDDIDMSGIENWTPLNTDTENYLFYINFNGKGHVIRNFAPKNTGVNYQSFFGILCGGVKNVGFEDADVTCSPTGSAIVAAWAGRTASYSGSTFFEHVYVTGKLTVGSGYAGAIVGSVSGITDMRNCYAIVDITGASSVTGGIVGRVNDALTMENVYAAGTMNRGGGIVGGGMTSTTPAATYKNVAVWNNDFENFGETSSKDIISGLSFYNGSNFAKLQETVVGWDNTVWSCDMAEGSYPVLLPMADGITPMFTVDRQLNSKTVYTLTGVKMAESNANLKSLPKGIYVIGNKKVLVK